MENKELTLTLSIQEINTILTLVAKGPYDVVAELIGKIQSQASKQLEEDSKDVVVDTIK